MAHCKRKVYTPEFKQQAVQLAQRLCCLNWPHGRRAAGVA